MPNGFYGPKEEWQRREAPYLRIDVILHAFAERHGVELYKNYRDADRSLRFKDALSRTIWINATDLYGAKGTYQVSVIAYQDRPQRYIKQAMVAKAVAPDALDAALEQAAHLSASWSEADLELVAFEGRLHFRPLLFIALIANLAALAYWASRGFDPTDVATDVLLAAAWLLAAVSFFLYERYLAFHQRPSLILRWVAALLAGLAVTLLTWVLLLQR